MNKVALIVVVTIGLIAGIAVGIATRTETITQEPVLSSATLLTVPRPLPDFSLTGADKTAINNAALKGQWTLVFFGFTHCPDVCPTTLATLNRMVEQSRSAKNSRTPTVLFISVDPMRDTPDKIKDYVQFFNPEFLGATADTLTLQSLTRAMSVAFEYRPTNGGDDYTVDHTSAVLLVNPDAMLHAIFSSPHRATNMADDLQAIVNAYL